MVVSNFRFNDKQIKALSECWKRPKERVIAELYLREVEGLVAQLMENNTSNQSTSIKDQIALASALRNNVVNRPKLLEQLPRDFEKLLATVWLRHKYGESYFQQHSEACRKDAENNTVRRMLVAAAVQGLAPPGAKNTPTVKTELSNLPPNYFQQIKTDADFLKIVAVAAADIEWFLKGSKTWLDKSDDQKGLIFMLIFSYERHFGKLPSVANKGRDGYLPPFRGFLILLSEIINSQKGYFQVTLGAPITRDLLEVINKMRMKVILP